MSKFLMIGAMRVGTCFTGSCSLEFLDGALIWQLEVGSPCSQTYFNEDALPLPENWEVRKLPGK